MPDVATQLQPSVSLVCGIGHGWTELGCDRVQQEPAALRGWQDRAGVLGASVRKAAERGRVLTQDTQNSGGAAKPDLNLTVRAALDRAAAKISGKFSRTPMAEASIRHMVGATYADMTLYPQAQAQLERAVELRTRLQGRNDPSTLQAKYALGEVYRREGRLTDAENISTETLATQRRVLGSENRDTLLTAQTVAEIYQEEGKYAQAEALNRELVTHWRRVQGENSTGALAIEDNLATVYIWQGKYAEAERVQRQIIGVMLRARGVPKRHPFAATGNLLAMTVGFEGKFAEAETLYRQSVEGLEQFAGKQDRDTLIMTEGIAWACLQSGKYAEGDALFSQVLNTQRRVLGNDHPITLVTLSDWGAAYRYRGMYDKAEALLTEAADGRRRKLGIGHPGTLNSVGDLGWVYLIEGRYSEAEHLLEEATAGLAKARTGVWQEQNVVCALGAALVAQIQYARAEPLLVGGFQKMLDLRATIPAEEAFDLQAAARSTVKLYRDWNKPQQAEEWQRKSRQAGVSI